MADPEETVIRGALKQAGIHFTEETHPDNHGLDFYLPDARVHIEVKQFHSDRIAEQMSRAPNVIALQGSAAVLFFAALLWRQQPEEETHG